MDFLAGDLCIYYVLYFGHGTKTNDRASFVDGLCCIFVDAVKQI